MTTASEYAPAIQSAFKPVRDNQDDYPSPLLYFNAVRTAPSNRRTPSPLEYLRRRVRVSNGVLIFILVLMFALLATRGVLTALGYEN